MEAKLYPPHYKCGVVVITCEHFRSDARPREADRCGIARRPWNEGDHVALSVRTRALAFPYRRKGPAKLPQSTKFAENEGLGVKRETSASKIAGSPGSVEADTPRSG